MRAYLCGPMSHLPQYNFPLFDAATMALRSDGWDVISPAELDSPKMRDAALASSDGEDIGADGTNTWADLLARDIKEIADNGVEAIIVLPGWENSKGAKLETFVGRLLKLPILAYPSLNPIEQYKLEYTHALPAPGIIQPPPPWIPVDTAESVQADAELDYFDEQGVPAHDREWRIRDPKTGGEKNAKQAVLGDAAPETLTELARVYGFGRKKYDRLNYLKGYDWSLSYDACERHLRAFWERKENDGESGLHHLAHAAWHCLTLMAFSIRNLGTDDRP